MLADGAVNPCQTPIERYARPAPRRTKRSNIVEPTLSRAKKAFSQRARMGMESIQRSVDGWCLYGMTFLNTADYDFKIQP